MADKSTKHTAGEAWKCPRCRKRGHTGQIFVIFGQGARDWCCVECESKRLNCPKAPMSTTEPDADLEDWSVNQPGESLSWDEE